MLDEKLQVGKGRRTVKRPQRDHSKSAYLLMNWKHVRKLDDLFHGLVSLKCDDVESQPVCPPGAGPPQSLEHSDVPLTACLEDLGHSAADPR